MGVGFHFERKRASPSFYFRAKVVAFMTFCPEIRPIILSVVKRKVILLSRGIFFPFLSGGILFLDLKKRNGDQQVYKESICLDVSFGILLLTFLYVSIVIK